MDGFRIPNAVVDDHLLALRSPGLALYVVLARHADAQGRCFPSVDRLAKLLGSKRPTVRRALASLVDRGLIERVAKGNGLPVVTMLRRAEPGPEGDRVPNGTGSSMVPVGTRDQGPDGTGTGARRGPLRMMMMMMMMIIISLWLNPVA